MTERPRTEGNRQSQEEITLSDPVCKSELCYSGIICSGSTARKVVSSLNLRVQMRFRVVWVIYSSVVGPCGHKASDVRFWNVTVRVSCGTLSSGSLWLWWWRVKPTRRSHLHDKWHVQWNLRIWTEATVYITYMFCDVQSYIFSGVGVERKRNSYIDRVCHLLDSVLITCNVCDLYDYRGIKWNCMWHGLNR